MFYLVFKFYVIDSVLNEFKIFYLNTFVKISKITVNTIHFIQNILVLLL